MRKFAIESGECEGLSESRWEEVTRHGERRGKGEEEIAKAEERRKEVYQLRLAREGESERKPTSFSNTQLLNTRSGFRQR